MADSTQVQVRGLSELQTALNLAARNMPISLREAADAAAREVTQRAKGRAQSIRWPGSTAKSAASVRYMGGGSVRYGGQPWDMGTEFGSYRYHQFSAWLGNKEDAGYFFWPSVRDWEQGFQPGTWLDRQPFWRRLISSMRH